jgi:hypothetical protein
MATAQDARTQDNQNPNEQEAGKAIIQSVPPAVPVDPPITPLQLSDAKRAQIAKVLIESNYNWLQHRRSP